MASVAGDSTACSTPWKPWGSLTTEHQDVHGLPFPVGQGGGAQNLGDENHNW